MGALEKEGWVERSETQHFSAAGGDNCSMGVSPMPLHGRDGRATNSWVPWPHVGHASSRSRVLPWNGEITSGLCPETLASHSQRC